MNLTNKVKILIIMVLAALSGCNDGLDERTTLDFIGDSLIARWDLQSSFSSLITYNHGVSGSGVIYLESMSGKFRGKNVVVLSGTNDTYLYAAEDDRKAYVDRYLAAIENLNAKKVYLYELLPRDFKGDSGVNEYIRALNREIAEKLPEHSDIEYIKVYDLFAGIDGGIIEEYYCDGLHVNDLGYDILASRLFDKLK